MQHAKRYASGRRVITDHQGLSRSRSRMNSSRDTSVELFRHWGLYDRIILGNHMRHQQMALAVTNAAQSLNAPCRVLDPGCGDGQLAAMALCNCHCEWWHGVDLSRAALDSAHQLFPSQTIIHFTEGHLTTVTHQLAEQWLQGRSTPPNLLLASYALHHLSESQLQQTLADLACVPQPRAFCWIDLYLSEDESRQEWLHRFHTTALPTWSNLTEADVSEVIAHMQTSDFPLTESRRVELATQFGFQSHEVLYRDDFFLASVFR